ncbi:MAG TPA: type IV toxin-antitoxin system AbiEi family antitoxin domain-containing protein [Actinomycetota bacterium]|jgi:hypothetical protein|nr:type IV toxin-antitoxin system AbiEi family antitoxin domain-containing protein [Actinomycetota bacterium]HVM10248.1 type IV toxin-antitoxin system AbiEi family antitoxin domain-containing protein [Acidimicrobiales bacterium]
MATLDSVARRQLGLLTFEQLATFGGSESRIDRALRSGELFRMRKEVVRTAGSAITRHQAWLAAVLAAPSNTVVSHRTATKLLRFPNCDDPDAIDLLREGRVRPKGDGVAGHKTLALPKSHVTTRHRVPTTTPARTFVDVSTFDGIDLPAIARAELRKDRRFIVEVARCIGEVPVSGRRGRRAVREVLAIYVPGVEPGDSDPEFEIADLIDAAGYPRPTMGIPVLVEGHKHRIDCGWADRKAGFEYQSDQYHMDPIAKHEDDAKLRRLKRAGWDIWPITSRTTADEILASVAYIFGPGALHR